jgi:crossover junction endodeoxyribonuclease RuvC
MIILGIDPGLATVGYSIIEKKDELRFIECGCITTAKEDNLITRISQIAVDLNALLDVFKPDCLAIEELFFNKNVKTGIKVAQVRGVIMYEAAKRGLEVCEYNPLQIKMVITGDGRADKIQIQTMIKKILNLPAVPKPDDAADAVAVGLVRAYKGVY